MQPNCIVCGTSESLDSHHIIPVSYGGPLDGPQVWLCNNDHRKCHTAAGRVYSGKSTGANLFSPEEFARAMPIIQGIVSAKIRMEHTKRPIDTIRRFQIDIPQPLYLAIHRKKQDMGYSSMQAFVLAVLETAVKGN